LKVWLDKECLDTKQREILDSVLLRANNIEIIDHPGYADYRIIDARQLDNDVRLPGKRYIVCDFGDVGQWMGGLRRDHDGFRRLNQRATLIYLKVEWNMPYTNRLVTSENMIFLSLPLLLGGSAKNIYKPDDDGDFLFSRVLAKNPRDYWHDFGWIGNRSSDDRKRTERSLYDHYKNDPAFKHNLKWANKLKVRDGIIPDLRRGHTGYLISTRHIRAVHQDARENMDIPIADLMEIFKRTKVNISCNGHGVWCLKDGELLSRNCFVLRQHHKELDRNPLTPKAGKHWVVFTDDDLLKKLYYYIHNDRERERINDAGHDYFRRGIMGDWAEYYARRFEDFLISGNRRVFGDLLLN